jgi:hypothetical protein
MKYSGHLISSRHRDAACGVSTILRFSSAVIACIFVAMSRIPAFAQGCASCYTTTAAGGSQTINALRSGILLLLVPPTMIFIGIMFVLLRWRRPKLGAVTKLHSTQ